MPRFVYQARDAQGARVSGARDAATSQEALQALREAGFFVTKLLPAQSKEAKELSLDTAPLDASTPGTTGNGSARDVATLPARKWELAAVPEPPAPVKPSTPPPVVQPAPRPAFDPLRTPPAPRHGEKVSGANPQIAPLTSAAAQEAAENAVAARVPSPQVSTPPAPNAVLPSQAEAPLAPRYFLRAGAKDLSLFWSQMHSMLNAGVGISHAVKTMAANAPGRGLRAACAEMAPRLAAGVPFSELMEAYPGVFSPLMVGMIRAGEVGGFLDRMCLRLSEYSERDYHIQQTVRRETWYPKMVLLASIVIPASPPIAIAFFTGKNVIAAILACFISTVPTLAILAVVWGLWKFSNLALPITARANTFRYILDQAKLLIPIAGKTVRALATAKFCRSLGALQSAGTGVQGMIQLAASACGNAVIADSARRTIPRLEQGESMTDALAATRQFPGIAIQMLRTGEETGNFEAQLEKVADFLEQDAETTIKQSVVVLGILALVFVGIRVCVQLVQFYTGYFNNIFDTVDQMQ
jgi:type IV pilus assembly protein PilC